MLPSIFFSRASNSVQGPQVFAVDAIGYPPGLTLEVATDGWPVFRRNGYPLGTGVEADALARAWAAHLWNTRADG